MAHGNFKLYLLSFFCIAGFQLLCFPIPSFPMSWILSSQRPSHDPEEFPLRKSFKRLSVSPFSWWLIPSSYIFIHCIAHISQEANRIILIFTLKFELLWSWSFWKPQARTSVGMSLLHTCAGWPSIKDENYASTTQMTTANPWPLTLTFSVAHHPFVNLFSDYEKKKKLSTSSSVSKHLILCRCPTGTKVVRHWSARSWWCYWLIQPGLGVLINKLTEHQHWKRPLCAQDVFCLKVFYCCCCFCCFGNKNYIYIFFFTYTCDYILMNTR